MMLITLISIVLAAAILIGIGIALVYLITKNDRKDGSAK